ncbi:Fungal transcriptional regulatory protein [Cordyceps fumosorosea ARSEF 2679]|uniref:Fungal transcriptional regulatory protein n=1 Tax=Cordyceps fumosorosea (strain ARSEF 2679) TaxID=1081104 RepID=A0A167LNY7_CORFA|nr:Fungal transcriptional regulatory protein [Cordyceps fumosorosea ARSEF 2679]OAA53314.1 Fungal transcriptional regulatory protein [Cordyceps fumosorosea ARSEF 2679]
MPDVTANGDPGERPRKRARKSRGTGLRTTTGCLTCRKRHKKCDEKRPVCGPCSISDRQCAFPENGSATVSASVTSAQSTPVRGQPTVVGGNHRQPESAQERQPETSSLSPAPARQPDVSNDYGSHVGQALPAAGEEQLASAQGDGGFICSPQSISSESWSANFASIRWLDLLASDAVQADNGYPALANGLLLAADGQAPAPRLPHQATPILVHVSPALLNGQAQLPDDLDPELERTAWQSGGDVELSAHEATLFRHFADRCASWLDVFDPRRLFSSYAIRLAIRNAGLMKAILALSSKHRHGSDGAEHEEGEWIRYYYETLQYVREALRYPSYSHSEELLATALTISAYEMLDEADGSGNWQRHLKGIFWIQRSQDVDGGCGGLRQAVWWAWLRQDVWAAFRESRACLSFWAPRRAIGELDQDELADRAIYILSQAINYRAAALQQAGGAGGGKLAKQRERLAGMMEQWRACIGDEYKVLPTPRDEPGAGAEAEVFTPLWIHPPQFGTALQAFSFAQILLTLHGGEAGGFRGYLKMQRTLSEAVNTICGIAMRLTEEGCQVLSAQCLYGAGLCVTEAARRERIVRLMEDCEARVGWPPMARWREDLRRDWERADADDYGGRGDDGR